MAETPITGLDANDIVPGAYMELNFAQGAASSGVGSYAAVILANKTAAGTATVDTVLYGPDTAVTLTSEADARLLGGTGSEAHRAVKRFLAVNKTTPLYVVFVTESVGAKATGTITITVTATGTGFARTYVGDEYCDAPIANTDTVTTVATAIRDAINAKTDWPVTASNSSGVVTITAKQNGLRGNWLRYSCQIITTPGTSIGTASSATATAFFTGGTTADSNTTALATILPFRFYYIISAAEDATQFGAVLTQVNAQALPVTGIRQRAFTGVVDTLANGITVATGVNAARGEFVCLTQSDAPPSELAATGAAVYALGEGTSVPKVNWNGYGNGANDLWPIKAPRSGAAPTRAQIKSGLNNGLTMIKVEKSGRTSIVKRITSRSLNGSTADYRIRDAHKVTICDLYCDDLQAEIGALIADKKIGNDPVSSSAKRPGPTVITPNVVKQTVNKKTSDYGEKDLVDITRVAAIQAATQCTRSTSPTTRITVRVPFEPIDIIDQVGTLVEQVA